MRRRASTRGSCRCSPALWIWPSGASSRGAPAATTRGSNLTTDWGELTQPEQLVLADAQTSGGLLIATRIPRRSGVALDAGGVAHAEIGEVVAGQPGRIRVDGRLPR